jgi:GR25 family glycosyltransferase involved in LPS biosynthesis
MVIDNESSDTNVLLKMDDEPNGNYSRIDLLHARLKIDPKSAGNGLNNDISLPFTKEASPNTLICNLCDFAAYKIEYIRCTMDFLRDSPPEIFTTTPSNASWIHHSVDQVYVMHYTPMSERFLYMKNFLESHGIESKIVKSFDREALSEEDLKCLNPGKQTIDPRKWMIDSHKRNLTLGEISLSAKHFAAFYDMIQINLKNALVFEDDAELEPSFTIDFEEKFRKAVESVPDNYDIISVGGCENWHCPDYKTASPLTPFSCRKSYTRRAHAYIISYAGAMKMFKSLPNRYPLDSQMNVPGLDINIYWTEPSMFRNRKSLIQSGIRG